MLVHQSNRTGGDAQFEPGRNQLGFFFSLLHLAIYKFLSFPSPFTVRYISFFGGGLDWIGWGGWGVMGEEWEFHCNGCRSPHEGALDLWDLCSCSGMMPAP